MKNIAIDGWKMWLRLSRVGEWTEASVLVIGLVDHHTFLLPNIRVPDLFCNAFASALVSTVAIT